jgi:hypothetical protein
MAATSSPPGGPPPGAADDAPAVAVRRYDVEVHALCAMSTHVHLVVTAVLRLADTPLA